MLDELTQSAAAAVQMAKAAGAGDAAAVASRTTASELRVRKGTLEKAQEDLTRSLTLQLYVDGRYANHSTTDLRPDRLKGFVTEAVAMTRALEPDPFRRITPPSLFADLPQADLDLVDPTVGALSNDERVAWITELGQVAEDHPQVISAEATCAVERRWGAAVGSNGFSGQWESTALWLGAEVTVQDEGDRRPQSGTWMGARYRSDVPSSRAIGEEARRFAVSRLGSHKGPTVQTVMVVDPRAAARLVSKLLSANRASLMQQGRSHWAKLMGQRAFSEVLTVTDEPLRPRGLASRQFDGEGIAARTLPIVEAGVVKTFYVDTYYGAKLKLDPTTGGPSNLIVGTGSRSRDQITADLDDGILVTGWLGGNSDPTTGDFSFGCQGHRIRAGKLGEPINEMNVTGNFQALFSTLVEVGSDPWPYGALLSPTLVFDGVQFSGA